MPTISCIICAYNEEKTIEEILSVLLEYSSVEEVIVVNDGSTDNTDDIVRGFERVQLISHPKNLGKSAALASGIAAARCDFIMLLDADLIGLTQENIVQLTIPVLLGQADVTVSLRKNSLLVYRLIGLDFISGERVFARALLRGKIAEIARLPRFGFEAYFNRLLIEQKLRVSIVQWPNVMNNRKTKKMGFWRGTWAEFRMLADLFRFASPWEIVAQNYHMLSLASLRGKRT